MVCFGRAVYLVGDIGELGRVEEVLPGHGEVVEADLHAMSGASSFPWTLAIFPLMGVLFCYAGFIRSFFFPSFFCFCNLGLELTLIHCILFQLHGNQFLRLSFQALERTSVPSWRSFRVGCSAILVVS